MTTPPPTNTHKRNLSMTVAISIFAVLGLIWMIYWWTYGRIHEYTDDAYVEGNQVTITPRVNGAVISFSALDGDFVPEGKVLIELDPEDAKVALEKASAELANSVRDVARLFENAKRDYSLVEAKKAEFIKAAQDYEHRRELVEEGGVSLEDFEHAQAALSNSFFSLNATEHQLASSLAQIENTTPQSHPLIEKAKSQLKDAYLSYQRCQIKAPVSGIVAQKNVEVGEQVKIGQSLMAIVPLNQLWITANFKETQLGRMRIGQPVSFTTDIYGNSVVFKGTVVGIGGGTGSVFSVLPPQNATGNWIKIVQRVPVRISLDGDLIKRLPLRLGLSTKVTVETKDTEFPFVPTPLPDKPLFQTTIFEDQEAGVQALIDQIISDNLPSPPQVAHE